MDRRNNSQAVATAGERLQSIEAWSRRTAIAATVGAACLGILAALALSYTAVTVWTVVSVRAELRRSFGGDDTPRPVLKIPRPTRSVPISGLAR